MDASDGNGGNCTPSRDVSTEQLNEEKEIAIRYDGNVAPILALTDEDWDGWTEISAYDIDEENGIAYYSYENIANAWGDLSTVGHLFVRASSDMTIYLVAAIPAAELVTGSDVSDVEKTESSVVYGDINLDSACSIADLVILQKYLLREVTLTQQAFQNADLTEDMAVNGYDLSIYRQLLCTSETSSVISDFLLEKSQVDNYDEWATLISAVSTSNNNDGIMLLVD